MKLFRYVAFIVIASLFITTGCSRDESPGSANGLSEDLHNEAEGELSNRVDIPPAVRQNLGITFVTVEARRVEQTLRVPGRFEFQPTARREQRTMLAGRVELLVEQYDRVERGAPLYRIESPAWRELQQQLTDAIAAIERQTTRLASYVPLRAAHHNHEKLLESIIAIREQRVEQLEALTEAGGGRLSDLIEAQSATSTAEAELAETLEKEAELDADESEARSNLNAARANKDFLLDKIASILRMSVDELVEPINTPFGPRPRWRSIDAITVHAEAPGVVETISISNGAWATQETAVLSVIQPDRLRFRGVGLQSDLGRIRDGLSARIVAPSPTRAQDSIDLAQSMTGTLQIGLSGDPDERTVDLIVTPESLASWARSGVSAQLEITTDATTAPSLSIPLAAVQQDGLAPVFFRRDPVDPNKAIRTDADLGIDDGRWVVVHSGLRAGDEIVLDGAFQLMLASAQSGGLSAGGHFHADGTFHSGEEDE